MKYVWKYNKILEKYKRYMCKINKNKKNTWQKYTNYDRLLSINGSCIC